MVVIKVTFPESIRRISISNALEGYAALKRCVKQEIRDTAHRINYTDEDNDQVTVGLYEEFSVALNENINKFHITFTEENISHEGSSSQRLSAEKCTETPSPRPTTENIGSTGDLSKDVPTEVPDFPCPDGDLDEEYEELEDNNSKDHEPPKNKSSFYEMKNKLLQKICSNLEKQHESSFGVACTFSVEIDNKSGAAFIECSFCDVKLKVKKLVESNVQQAVDTHMKRKCHKSNAYALIERDSLNSEEFADVELAEAKSVQLLKSIHSAKEFEIVTISGKSYARCLTCGPLSPNIALVPKAADFKTSINTHLDSKGHQSAKKQAKLTSFFPNKNTEETTAREKLK